MKKGKKVYTLKIWFNDENGDCTGLCEYIDEVESEDSYREDEHQLARIIISDFIPQKYIKLLNCFELGVA